MKSIALTLLINAGVVLLATGQNQGKHPTFWKVDGNGGTRSEQHFVGTIDDQPLEFKVNSRRALRLEPDRGRAPNLIGGSEYNYAAGYVEGATIGGGGSAEWAGAPAPNVVSGMFGTIGGGMGNVASGPWWATVGGGLYNAGSGWGAVVGGGMHNHGTNHHATVSGGIYNISGGYGSAVGGGWGNRSLDYASTVSGGLNNDGSGPYATVGGGLRNVSSNIWATVPGGTDNVAGGRSSFAAGSRGMALHDGSFVWSDFAGLSLSVPPFVSTRANEFSVRATGGFRFITAIDPDGAPAAGVSVAPGSGSWSTLSDRYAKENFRLVNPGEVLEKVVALPLSTWNYRSQDRSIRHLGPVAQDFHAAFGVGEDERHIGSVDADGVALAAIQGLNEKLAEQNRALRRELNAQAAAITEMQRSLRELRALLAGHQREGVAGD